MWSSRPTIITITLLPLSFQSSGYSIWLSATTTNFIAYKCQNGSRRVRRQVTCGPTQCLIVLRSDGSAVDVRIGHVPGTVLLNDHAAQTQDFTQTLKHGTGRSSEIVLSPQPSEDPNDPLNWPMWKKELIVIILSLGAMLNAGTNVCSPIFIDVSNLNRDRFSMPPTLPSPNNSKCLSPKLS